MKKRPHEELIDTLKIKYFSKYIFSRNPEFSYKELSVDYGKSKAVILKNGKRKLYVINVDDKNSDRTVNKTGIHRTLDGQFIMNVKNSDTKDYEKLTKIIDNALNIK